VEGRVWDLAKAYRQLARTLRHAEFSIIASWCSRSQAAKLYEQPVLAFGAASSVANFCWVARAIWHVAVVLGKVTWTHYVDDYPTVTFKQVAPDLETFVCDLLGLLGWRLKVQTSFGPSFAALGVVFRFPPSSCSVVVENRPERIEGIKSTIEGIAAPRDLNRKTCTTLRGRLHFARSNLFGRAGGAAFRLLGVVADSDRPTAADKQAALDSLWLILRILEVSPPRNIPARFPRPALLYTDGACEHDASGRVVATMGGLVFDSAGAPRHHFGTIIPADVLRELGLEGQAQVVGQAELLPVLAAKLLWRDLLQATPLIVFIDNDSARHALVAGYSPALASARIVGASALQDARLAIHQWVARVASESNPADAPSRLDFEAAEALGSKRTRLEDWQPILRALRFEKGGQR